MTVGKEGDWEKTKDQVLNSEKILKTFKNLKKGTWNLEEPDNPNWLGHRGSQNVIFDQMILEGCYTRQDIAAETARRLGVEAPPDPMARVQDHILHLTESCPRGGKTHQLKVKEVKGILSFDVI